MLSRQANRIWDLEELDRKMDFGNLLHNLLAQIKVSSDIGPVLKLAVDDGILSINDKPEIEQKTTMTYYFALLEHEE